LLLPQHLKSMAHAKRAHVELVSTQAQRARVRALLGSGAPHMEVFPPYIDTAFFRMPSAAERAASRRKWRVNGARVHVVYAGRLLPAKGVEQLLRSMGGYRSDWVLTYAGEDERKGVFAKGLAQQAQACGFGSAVRFYPALTREPLRSLFWSADVFVYPSVHADENFGIVTREAMSCGVPAVVTDFAGLAEAAQHFPWAAVATYPSLGGARFALSGLTRAITQSAHKTVAERRLVRAFVCKEQSRAEAGLVRALGYLSRVPAQRFYFPAAAAVSPRWRIKALGAFTSNMGTPRVLPLSAWTGFSARGCAGVYVPRTQTQCALLQKRVNNGDVVPA
jgi:glycosyltransferase involved in cell wall biosynthesis